MNKFFLMTIELLFIYPLFYRQNGSVFFIMYAMNTWNTGECEHEELERPPTENNKVIPYLKNEPPFQNLQKIVLNYKWLESVKYYTRFR